MNALEAKRELRALLDKHELYHVEAKLNGRMTRVFGRYRHYRHTASDKSVELSVKLVELNDRERVMQTIVHEVAHALTEGHGHDSVWRAKCIELGGNGQATWTLKDTKAPVVNRRKWRTVCSEHGEGTIVYSRRKWACSHCCRKYNNGRYDSKYDLTFKEVS